MCYSAGSFGEDTARRQIQRESIPGRGDVEAWSELGVGVKQEDRQGQGMQGWWLPAGDWSVCLLRWGVTGGLPAGEGVGLQFAWRRSLNAWTS